MTILFNLGVFCQNCTVLKDAKKKKYFQNSFCLRFLTGNSNSGLPRVWNVIVI